MSTVCAAATNAKVYFNGSVTSTTPWWFFVRLTAKMTWKPLAGLKRGQAQACLGRARPFGIMALLPLEGWPS
jgi:hypothetical protein